jgi:hypothetical protein
LPSGEKYGSLSMAGVLVIRFTLLPARSAVQMSEPYVKTILSLLISGCLKSFVSWLNKLRFEIVISKNRSNLIDLIGLYIER